ncbi:MAG: phage holin family protein [Petrimonas sp.]|jgi:uncharacterized membrane protein|nr:MAG: hypothetical protein BWZ00_01122 [Bacteroidetes bacterium ADurb.BinA174]
MEDKTVTGLFDEMKSDVTSYVTNTIEIVKLDSFEKISKGAATITFVLVMLGILFLTLAVAFITLGFYLGDVLESTWKGFGVVALGAILILLILLLVKKAFKKSITNSVVKFLTRKEDEEVKYTTKS